MSITRYLVDTNVLLRFLSGEPAKLPVASFDRDFDKLGTSRYEPAV